MLERYFFSTIIADIVGYRKGNLGYKTKNRIQRNENNHIL